MLRSLKLRITVTNHAYLLPVSKFRIAMPSQDGRQWKAPRSPCQRLGLSNSRAANQPMGAINIQTVVIAKVMPWIGYPSILYKKVNLLQLLGVLFLVVAREIPS